MVVLGLVRGGLIGALDTPISYTVATEAVWLDPSVQYGSEG